MSLSLGLLFIVLSTGSAIALLYGLAQARDARARKEILRVLSETKELCHVHMIVDLSEGRIEDGYYLYGVMRRLEEDGLVTSAQANEPRRPERMMYPRWVYRLTNEGRVEYHRLLLSDDKS